MKLSLPWIQSRRRLIVAVIADGILFASLYYILYGLRFGVLPGLSSRLAVLLAIWSLTSYVIGRYFSGVERGAESDTWQVVGKQLIGTGSVLLLTLGITLLHIWLFNQNPVQASFRSFLIPFLGSLAISSPFVQLTICRLVAIRDRESNSTWKYIGSELGFRRLQEMLKLSRLSVCLEYVRPENLDKTSSDQFIVDRFDDQPADILKALFRLQLKGSLVLSRLAWCEVVLQRFPSELLSLEDILSGRFFVARGTFQSRLKRIGDIAVSAALLIITSPVVLISGILIKLSDRGPVFYSQVRTGLDEPLQNLEITNHAH